MKVQSFRRYSVLLALGGALLTGSTLCAEEGEQEKKLSKEEVLSPQNVKRISEAYGYYIYKSLDNPFMTLDVDSFVMGAKNAQAGNPAPMSEQELMETGTLIQEYSYEELSMRNLKQADDFLQKNAQEPGVVEIEAGKLQYIVLQPGTGEEVTEANVPVLHYTGKYLNGEILSSSVGTDKPLTLPLKQVIPGLRKGVLGMKKGEKRRIFIHPDLGYGTAGQTLPNALLIFDIEVVEVKSQPSKEDVDSNSVPSELEEDPMAMMTYTPSQSPGDEAMEGEEEDEDAESEENNNG